MILNKEVVMNIVKHVENVIDISFFFFKCSRFRELFILGSSPGLLVSETLSFSYRLPVSGEMLLLRRAVMAHFCLHLNFSYGITKIERSGTGGTSGRIGF